MTKTSGPVEHPEDTVQKAHTITNTDAHKFSPMEGFSPESLQSQPHNLSSQTTISVIRQRKESRMRLANLSLRSAALLFSFLSFVIMAANNQDNGPNFDDFEEYRYSLAISVVAFVYLACQLGKGIYEMVVGYALWLEVVVSYVDFIGDQVMAYLMISAASSAASWTNRLREGGDSKFTDMAAGSVSILFIGFAVVATSCLLSGYTVSRHIR